MQTVLLDEVVQTDDGQFDLVWAAADDGLNGESDAFDGQVDGQVGAAHPRGVHVVLGRRSGGSHVRIVVHATPPPPAEDRWEDVVEVSVLLPDREPRWASWAGECGGALVGLLPGAYRLRVSARGRDAGAAGEEADEVVDWYLLELWSAPRGQDAVLRSSSQDARYWHDAWGGQR